MAGERYDSVYGFLESQRRTRPYTFEEISGRVDKSPRNVIREINTLLVRRMISVVRVRFDNREVPFYTIRQRVVVTIVDFSKE